MSLVGSRRRPPEREPEGFGLLQIARSLAEEEPSSVLPPGRRDASGFWLPTAYRDARELFTAYQRSLQEKQRSVQRERRSGATATTAECEPAEVTIPLPPQCTDGPPADRTATLAPLGSAAREAMRPR